MAPRVAESPSGFKRVKCGHCYATIEYAPIDVRRVDGRDISGEPDGYEYVICPYNGCGREIVLRRW